jgi:hypothetical protein
MAETRLILHVKGTDAETKELPKHEVKAAVADGKLTYSQLIWSATEQAWKQVRDFPELMPAESLILHVKGTESTTREWSKQAVKNAISRGEITHSQLIWSATDGAWKQVRELPDLLPGETMIIHVKGTESETRELPKPAIRAAISKGEITHSQLIWSPLDASWKPVREMPELLPGESLILHVKGTEQTTELPKKAIRTAIKEGKITHSQLIWSAEENQWKQVRELPELLPSQKLAPAPAPRPPVPLLEPAPVPSMPQPTVARPARTATPTPKARPAVVAPPRVTVGGATPQVTAAGASPTATPSVATPKIATPAVATPSIATPKIATPTAATPKVATAVAAKPVAAKAVAAKAAARAGTGSAKDYSVKTGDEGGHTFKWICIGLGVVILLVIAANVLLVSWPYSSAFGKTPSGGISSYAHLGAFVQPNVIVIHIPRSEKITPDNITDVLVDVARSTPINQITNDNFDRVALTSGWASQYSFSGLDWKHLAGMKQNSALARRDVILQDGVDAGGQPLLGESTLNDQAREAKRAAAWAAFVENFSKPGQ